MSKKKRLLFLLPVAVVAAVAIALLLPNGSDDDSAAIKVSGNIEITDAEISFKIAGRVMERLVSEGESVEKGQPVARLEDSDLAQEVILRRAEVRAAQATLDELEAGYLPEEISQALAAVQRAQSRLEELKAGSRPQEIAAAEAAVETSRVNVDHLRIEYDRQARLLKENTISQREFDRANSEYERALSILQEAEEKLKLVREGPRREQIDQAGSALDEARERYEMLKKGPRKETIAQAKARVEQAEAALGMAEIRLGYAAITAPFPGIVLSENVEPGEFVAPGTPVVTLGNLQDVWLRAYISETDLGRVKLGQQVRVYTDTYPDKTYKGRISFISSEAEFTPKNVQTEKERVKLVYRVKIEIPNPEMELKPGMPADAEIELNQGAR